MSEQSDMYWFCQCFEGHFFRRKAAVSASSTCNCGASLARAELIDSETTPEDVISFVLDEEPV